MSEDQISENNCPRGYHPFLVIININKVLVHRISGGQNYQNNKSNNNTKIRPGATELIKYLYDSKLFRIAFASSMNKSNHFTISKIVLQGRKTRMNISEIFMIPGDTTTVQDPQETNGYYVLKNKAHSINRVNLEHCIRVNGKLVLTQKFDKYNFSNTLVIDHQEMNIRENPDISLLVPEYTGDNSDDDVMFRLMKAFEEFEEEYRKNKDVNLSKYVINRLQ